MHRKKNKSQQTNGRKVKEEQIMLHHVAVFALVFILNTIETAPSLRDRDAATGLTTYDQKQTGKYNIHLNIKDVAIIALDSERVNTGVGSFGDDYYEDYDLSDFTVKPIYGLIGFDTTSSNPLLSSTPSIIHSSEADDDPVDLSENNSNSTDIDQPNDAENVVVITSSTTVPTSNSVGANKTQNVVILNPSTIPSAVTILTQNDTSSSGISVTTPTLSPEELPPNKHPILQTSLNSGEQLAQIQFDKIPVQIIMEPLLSTRKLHKNRSKPSHYSHNKLRATPSNNRRITPPHDTGYDSDDEDYGKAVVAHGQPKLRRNGSTAGRRRNHKGKRGSM